jgi:hypothetical protein
MPGRIQALFCPEIAGSCSEPTGWSMIGPVTNRARPDGSHADYSEFLRDMPQWEIRIHISMSALPLR